MLELEKWSHSSFNNQCFAAGGDGGVGEVSTLCPGQTCKTERRNIPGSYQVPSTGLHSLPWGAEKNNWIRYCQILVDSAYVREIKVLGEIVSSPSPGYPFQCLWILPPPLPWWYCSCASGDRKKKKGLKCHWRVISHLVSINVIRYNVPVLDLKSQRGSTQTQRAGERLSHLLSSKWHASMAEIPITWI